MPELSIRKAGPDDVDLILNFITELAIYEKAPDEVTATSADIHHSLFAAEQHCYGLICSLDNEAVGFAIYFYNYSTWLGKPGLYLEDIYVTPVSRGHGAGKYLMQHLAQIAVSKDCKRFEWAVLDWNKSARDFYESIGAEAKPEWVGYRLDGDALTEVANQGLNK